MLIDLDCAALWLSVFLMKQFFGGGVQENSLLSVARKPNCLQSRLLILYHLENHAKFQVRHLHMKAEWLFPFHSYYRHIHATKTLHV